MDLPPQDFLSVSDSMSDNAPAANLDDTATEHENSDLERTPDGGRIITELAGSNNKTKRRKDSNGDTIAPGTMFTISSADRQGSEQKRAADGLHNNKRYWNSEEDMRLTQLVQ